MEKAYMIKSMPDNHLYQEMDYGRGEGQGYGIYQNQHLVAYAWFNVAEYESGRNMDMEMIEVIEKEEGHGRTIIEFLFRHYSLDTMSGTILFDESLRPYYFWESLGADIAVEDEDDYWVHYEEGINIYFELNRNVVIKETNIEEESE